MYINGITNNFEIQNSKNEVILSIQLTGSVRRVKSFYTMAYDNIGITINEPTDLTSKKYVDDRDNTVLSAAQAYTNQ